MTNPYRQSVFAIPRDGVPREFTKEGDLIPLGLAGQSAGPPGLGPEPSLQHQPGGELLNKIQHPAFDTYEHLFRVLPEDTWFMPSVSPKKPVKFEIGSAEVPGNNFLLVTDYQFTPMRQSGIDPFDFVAAEDERFSGQMGFDITVNGRRMSNLFYQLDPAPVVFAKQAFGSAGSPRTSVFNKAAANSFGAVSGEGTSLLPARSNVQGARHMPFTLLAGPDSVVQLQCVIFRRIMSPLACIQGAVRGYTIHANTMTALLNRLRPR